MSELLPHLRLPQEGWISPVQSFPGKMEVWLEIGFGGGEQLVHQASLNPDKGFIGSEAFVNAIAKLLAAISARDLSNIRVFDADARLLLDRLESGSLARVMLLFPDPWPKVRHHKRRFINNENLIALHRVMRIGGELIVASDSSDYVRWILLKVLSHGGFEWIAERPACWRLRPADMIETRYEARARAQGSVPIYLRFRRLGSNQSCNSAEKR
jgi:tRNA (guanine-N7-)-methyltransferase